MGEGLSGWEEAEEEEEVDESCGVDFSEPRLTAPTRLVLVVMAASNALLRLYFDTTRMPWVSAIGLNQMCMGGVGVL